MRNFNSRQYGWCDVHIAICGRVLTEATGFKSTVKRKRERLYGRGSKAFDILDGNVEADGELSLWQSGLEALVAKAPDADITLMKFDVVVSYAPKGSYRIVTDIWKGFCPTENTKALKQGDAHMEVSIPGLILDVKYDQ